MASLAAFFFFPTPQTVLTNVFVFLLLCLFFLFFFLPVHVFMSPRQSCTACKPGQTPNNENTECDNCGLGRWGGANYQCHDCVVGTYQDDKGETTCKNCRKDHYGVALYDKHKQQRGAVSNTECESCPTNPDQTTGGLTGTNNKDACQCPKSSFYQTVDDQTNETKCLSCPAGADCSAKNGIKLEEIIAQPGYWRTNLKGDVFTACSVGFSTLNADELALLRCCPINTVTNQSICIQNNTFMNQTDDQCLTGYSGTLCLVCAKGYVKVGNNCETCPSGASIGIAIVPMVGVLVCLLVGLIVMMSCGKQPTTQAKKVNKW